MPLHKMKMKGEVLAKYVHLYGSFVVLKYFSVYLTITGMKNIFRFSRDLSCNK